MSDREWMMRAECRNYGLEVFFPRPRDHKGQAFAKSVCIDCPVFEACGLYAQATKPSHGIWAGEFLNEKNFTSATVRDSGHGTVRGYQAHRRRSEKPCDSCQRASERYNAEHYARRKASQ